MLIIDNTLKIPHDYYEKIITENDINVVLPELLSYRHVSLLLSNNIDLINQAGDLSKSPNINKTTFIKFSPSVKTNTENLDTIFPEFINHFIPTPGVVYITNNKFVLPGIPLRFSIIDAIKSALDNQHIHIKNDGPLFKYVKSDNTELTIGGFKTIKIDNRVLIEEAWLLEDNKTDCLFDIENKICLRDLDRNINFKKLYYDILMFVKYGKLR